MRKAPPAALTFGTAPRTAELQASAYALLAFSQPRHQRRRVSGKKVVAGRIEIDMVQIRRVEPHTMYLACERERDFEFFGDFLDQQAGGVDAVAGLRLAFHDPHLEAAHGGGMRAREPGKTRADDGQVKGLWHLGKSIQNPDAKTPGRKDKALHGIAKKGSAANPPCGVRGNLCAFA